VIGIDIVSISRFEKFLDRYGQKALKRFLSDDEISLKNSPQSYAGFWAAKEAVSKALGTGIGSQCSFFDIRLHHTKSGGPYFSLSNHIVKKFQITNTSLSISHDSGFAIAACTINSNLENKNTIETFD
jgi:holo-[acyl-carrier protein] synthase